MCTAYYWRTETTYHFRTETFAPHRHALVAVSPKWFHGLHFKQDGPVTFSDIRRTCIDKEHDRRANGDLRVIKPGDHRHLERWCAYVHKPPHEILKGREPLGAFGLGLAKIVAELKEAA
jgi:hypothetical protein